MLRPYSSGIVARTIASNSLPEIQLMTPRPRPRLSFLFAALVFLAAASVSSAHAQNGVCSNRNITAAFGTALHRAPNGSGNAGECDPGRYGGGAWSSQADLVQRVGAGSYCPNAWVGQIYKNLYNRYPSNPECDVTRYSEGPPASYMDLTNKIQGFQNAMRELQSLQPKQALVFPNGDAVDKSGAVVARAGTYLVASGGGNLVASGGGNILAPGVGNIITQDGGGYRVQSAGGKVVLGHLVRR